MLPVGARVRVERDPALDDIDRYGRLLRYVFKGRLNVNVDLVRKGAASVWFYDGDRGRYADQLLRAAENARASSAGPGARAKPFSTRLPRLRHSQSRIARALRPSSRPVAAIRPTRMSASRPTTMSAISTAATCPAAHSPSALLTHSFDGKRRRRGLRDRLELSSAHG